MGGVGETSAQEEVIEEPERRPFGENRGSKGMNF